MKQYRITSVDFNVNDDPLIPDAYLSDTDLQLVKEMSNPLRPTADSLIPMGTIADLVKRKNGI